MAIAKQSTVASYVCEVYTVRDTDNLHFSADMPHRFFEGSHAAIRRSPARQCVDHPRGNARIVCRSVQCRGRPRMNAEAYMLE